MGIIKLVQGDLLKAFEEGHVQVIGHGCNTQNLMGSGIAGDIKNKFHAVYETDTLFRKNFTQETGHHSVPAILGMINTTHYKELDGYIVNMYTQERTGPDADYQYLSQCLRALNNFCKERSIFRVGLPFIGAGIGGLDRQAVLCLINAIMVDVDVLLYVHPKDISVDEVLEFWNDCSRPKRYDAKIEMDFACETFLIEGEDPEPFNSVDTINANRFNNGEVAITFGHEDHKVYLNE